MSAGNPGTAPLLPESMPGLVYIKRAAKIVSMNVCIRMQTINTRHIVRQQLSYDIGVFFRVYRIDSLAFYGYARHTASAIRPRIRERKCLAANRNTSVTLHRWERHLGLLGTDGVSAWNDKNPPSAFHRHSIIENPSTLMSNNPSVNTRHFSFLCIPA